MKSMSQLVLFVTFLALTGIASAAPAAPALAAPPQITATNLVKLSWVASVSTVSGYKSYRSMANGGPYTLQAGSLGNVTSWTDTNVQAGTTYFYVVTAFDSAGIESVFSNQVSAVIPAGPPGPLVITTTSVPPCVAGSPCSAQFVITGGVTPYSLSIVGLPSGILPAGLGYSGSSTVSGSFDLSVTATDGAGSVPTSKTFTLLVSPAPAPGQTQSFWTSTDAPANQNGNDSVSVELGLKFTPSVSGTVIGIKFWKAPNSTGTHTGHLWGSGTAAIGSVTFSGETASGWQTASFASPVAVVAGTQYTVSYHTVQYAWNLNYFGAAKSVGNLSAPASAGAYCYGTSSCKPTSTWQASNYWVDVIFQPVSSAPPPVTITIAPTSTILQTGQTKQFTTTVNNATNTSVTWSSNAPNGLFTASSVGSFTVSATSVADNTKSASASVTVNPPTPSLSVDCSKIPPALTTANIQSGTAFGVTVTSSGLTSSCSGVLP